ncbi:hypothetical protein FACS189449_07850 [Alphaproteobacteria bacterium]|nr:hypothetical protein FACS189449_07850 [Alphaproteobacteria bacterium]
MMGWSKPCIPYNGGKYFGNLNVTGKVPHGSGTFAYGKWTFTGFFLFGCPLEGKLAIIKKSPIKFKFSKRGSPRRLGYDKKN